MKIFFDNVDFNSNSGPNSFGFKLASSLVKSGHAITDIDPDIQLSFIQTLNRIAPTILRLDGIYFNSTQDWKAMNSPISTSYSSVEAVIVQSNFDKELIERYFGSRENIHVVRNGTNVELINKIPPAKVGNKPRSDVWFCASSWRPHKRLADNIRYFHEHAPPSAILLVAGDNAAIDTEGRVFNIGNLKWEQLISVMKSASNFIHLSWLDHCPNVVVDARACGCHIICSSSGGTKEVAGINSTIIHEEPWDYEPTELYNPPHMDFSNKLNIKSSLSSVDIDDVARIYLGVMEKVANGE